MLRGPFSGSNPNQPLRLSVLWHKKAAEAFLRVNFHLNDREPNHLLHCATTATESLLQMGRSCLLVVETLRDCARAFLVWQILPEHGISVSIVH